jgi:hypothetical protein
LRRLAWSLGAGGEKLAWIDDPATPASLAAELDAHASLNGVVVLVDDADAIDAGGAERLEQARGAGARLVLVGGARFAEGAVEITVPPLDERAAVELVRRIVPSLTDKLLKRVVELGGGRPGELRRLVRLIATDAVASAEDIEQKLGASADRETVPSTPLDRAVYYLDRGRFNDAKAALDLLEGDDRVPVGVARARLELGFGEAA